MSASLHNGSGTGIFDRCGGVWGGLADLIAVRGGTATARALSGSSWTARFATLDANYTSSTGAPSLGTTFDGFNQAITSWQSTLAGFFAQGQTLVANTIINQMNADTPLASKDINTALVVLIQQMVNNTETINLPTVSIGAAASLGSPNGNPTIVGSVLNRFGASSLAFAETVTLTCTRDSQTGGASVGQETLQAVGQAAVSDITSYLWPAGSGSSLSFNCIDPSQSNQNNNLTYNGTFNTFTNTNYPDNWVYLVGVATTNFAKVTSPIFGTTTNSLEMIGDGATLNSVCQPFNTAASTGAGAGGSPAVLKPSTVYQGNLMFQLSAGSPAAGVLEVSLIDGSNAIINDGAGTQNKVTQALTAIADTNWHALSFTFRTPAVMPSGYKLRVRFSTALSNGTNCFISSVGLTAPNAMYVFGPYLSAFMGSTKLILGDQFTAAVSNNWTTGSVSQWLMRMFGNNLRNTLGLQLPMTASSPTVPDSVVA